MSWIFISSELNSNSIINRIGHFNRWSSSKFKLKQLIANKIKLLLDVKSINQHYINYLDNFILEKMIMHERVTNQQINILISNGFKSIENIAEITPPINTRYYCAPNHRVEFRSSKYKFYKYLGKCLSYNIIEEMLYNKKISLEFLKSYKKMYRNMVTKHISKYKHYSSINKYLEYVSNYSLEDHVRINADYMYSSKPSIIFLDDSLMFQFNKIVALNHSLYK